MAKRNDTVSRPTRGGKQKYSSELAYVYVIQDDNGLIKTGHSDNPTRRLKQIQRTCGFNIVHRHFSPLCYNAARVENELQTEFGERLKQEEYVERASFEEVCEALDRKTFQTELVATPAQNLVPLQFQDCTIRVDSDEQGEPWFVARDVCEALGIYFSQIRRLDEDEKGLRSTHTLGGTQQIQCVNEAGLYNLILSCRRFKGEKGERIRQFKRWVTHEVLPQIRRQGYYNLYGEVNPSIQSLVNEIVQATLEKVSAALAPLTKDPVVFIHTQGDTVQKIQVSFPVKLLFEIKEL